METEKKTTFNNLFSFIVDLFSSAYDKKLDLPVFKVKNDPLIRLLSH